MKIPKISYFILSSHRSGSTLLCELLAKTGVAGKPAEYFMNWQGMSFRNWDLSDFPAYTARVIDEMQTSNGVFAVKFMAGSAGGIQGFVENLETFPTFRNLTVLEKLRAFFPNLACITLSRRNKVAQAVSWWKLVQSNVSHITDASQAPTSSMVYNFAAIDHLVSEIVMEEAAHQAFLNDIGIMPYSLVYEDFLEDKRGIVAVILNFLGVEDDYEFQESSHIKMQDALSDEWIDRYRQEKQEGWTNIRW